MKKVILAFVFSLCASHFVLAQEIKLLFGGDVTFGDTYHNIAKIGKNYGYSFEKLMPLINSSDYFVINLETSVTEHNKKFPKEFNFKAHKEDLKILKAGKVSAVSIANNHIYDYGRKGLFDTFAALEEYGIPYFGAGKTYEKAREAHRVTIKGKKFSFLAFGNNGADTSISNYVLHRNSGDIAKLVKREKQFSDYVIVFFHFGIELAKKPNVDQIYLAHLCIDNGADAVIGGHPHVTQPSEIYKGKPIAYSLGNFIFGGNANGPRYGMLYMVTIASKNVTGKEIPIVVSGGVTKYRPFLKE